MQRLEIGLPCNMNLLLNYWENKPVLMAFGNFLNLIVGRLTLLRCDHLLLVHGGLRVWKPDNVALEISVQVCFPFGQLTKPVIIEDRL